MHWDLSLAATLDHLGVEHYPDVAEIGAGLDDGHVVWQQLGEESDPVFGGDALTGVTVDLDFRARSSIAARALADRTLAALRRAGALQRITTTVRLYEPDPEPLRRIVVSVTISAYFSPPRTRIVTGRAFSADFQAAFA